jgi:hypothetical protein
MNNKIIFKNKKNLFGRGQVEAWSTAVILCSDFCSGINITTLAMWVTSFSWSWEQMSNRSSLYSISTTQTVDANHPRNTDGGKMQ